MLVSKIVERVDIPHEEGQWVDLRQLSFTAIEEAGKVKQRKGVADVRDMGGDVFEAIMRSSKRQVDDDDQERDPVDSYDWETLINKALVGWSYDGKPTLERIRDLDMKTARWMAIEICKRNPVEDEETAKNG